MAARTASFAKAQRVLAYAAANLDGDVSLEALALKARVSPFHLHRTFAAEIGETPKQLTLRLRIARAAALLLATRESVLDIALACGFNSHEAFIRAFRRQFGTTPAAYRRRGLRNASSAQALTHAAIVDRVAPCIGLYYRSEHNAGRKEMSYTIATKELAAQPVLVVRRRVKRQEIAATIGASLPLVFVYAQQHGIALSGLPFTRYTETGPGMVTMEPGMRIACSAPASPAGGGDVLTETLPGGLAAFTTHKGPYDKLVDAYAALEQWIADQGLKASGAPWECYINDPAEVPNPQDWTTEVYWPVLR